MNHAHVRLRSLHNHVSIRRHLLAPTFFLVSQINVSLGMYWLLLDISQRFRMTACAFSSPYSHPIYVGHAADKKTKVGWDRFVSNSWRYFCESISHSMAIMVSLVLPLLSPLLLLPLLTSKSSLMPTRRC